MRGRMSSRVLKNSIMPSHLAHRLCAGRSFTATGCGKQLKERDVFSNVLDGV